MGQRVDSRDVLDPNARTLKLVRATVVGHFQPTGPNASDDYEFVSEAERPVEIHARLEVQLEPRGAQFRVRIEGKVVRCRWSPTAEELQRAGSEAPSALRRLFLAEQVESFEVDSGEGTAALVRRLRDPARGPLD